MAEFSQRKTHTSALRLPSAVRNGGYVGLKTLIMFAYAQSPLVPLELDRTYTFPHTQGEITRVQVPDSTEPQLLLVRQLGIDVRLYCQAASESKSNAPLSRLGIEAVVLTGKGQCKVLEKVTQSGLGASIQVSTHRLSSPVLGVNHQAWFDYASAMLEEYDLASGRARALQKLGKVPIAGAAPEFALSLLLARANLERMDGQHAKAIASYAQAEPYLSLLPIWYGPVYNGMGRSLFALKRFAEAERAFSTVIAQAKSVMPVEVATAQNNRCLLLQQQDNLAAAQSCYAKVVQDFEALGELEFGSGASVNWALVAQRAGDPAKAEKVLLSVYRQRKAAPISRGLGGVCIQLASLYRQIGDYQSALSYSREAMSVTEKLGEPSERVRALRSHAEILGDVGERNRALSYLGVAQALADELQGLPGVYADQAALTQLPAQALLLHTRARDGFVKAQSLAGAMRQRLAIAQIAIKLGDYEAAKRELDTVAPEMANTTLARQTAFALTRAELALASQTNPAEAVFLLPRRQAQELRDTQLQIRAGLLHARWLQKQRHHKNAMAVLLELAELNQRTRITLPTKALAAAHEAQIHAWKDALLALPAETLASADLGPLWQALDRISLAPEFEFRAPAPALKHYRLLAAQLAADSPASEPLQAQWRRELDTLELEFSHSSKAVSSHSLEAWRNKLEPGECLVRYVMGSNSGWRITISAKEQSIEPIQSATQLRARIKASRVSTADAYELARSLLPARLDQTSRVLVIPDGELHQLPWMALAQHRQTTLEALVVAPGALPSETARAALSEGYRVLTFELNAVRPLPGVLRGRAELIQRFGKRLTVWPIAEKQLPATELLHIAGHGWISQEFPSAGALSGDVPATLEAQTFSLSEFRFERPPRVVLLSACGSATPDQFGAGNSMAQEIAARTGAIVIAPLEPIEDGRALRFERAFFDALEYAPPIPAFVLALAKTEGSKTHPLPPWQIFFGGEVGENNQSTQKGPRATAQ